MLYAQTMEVGKGNDELKEHAIAVISKIPDDKVYIVAIWRPYFAN